MIPNQKIIETINGVRGVLSCEQLNWCDFAVETTRGNIIITVCQDQDSSELKLSAGYAHVKGERNKTAPIVERIFRSIKGEGK